MKKLKYLLVGMTFLLCFWPGPVQAQEAFDIEKYTIVVDIDESGLYQINEEIVTNFNYQRHGIYRNIPTAYKMNWEIDGTVEEISYNWPIRKIKVYGDDHNTEYYSEGVTVQIGDADEYVYGLHTYRLSYQLQTHDLGISDGRQMFYYNLIGNDWDTTIAQADVTVNFPKPVQDGEFVITSGYYGTTTNEKASCTWNTDRTSIHCVSTKPLDNYQSITLYVPLGNNYYSFPTYEGYIYFGVGASVLLTLLFAFFYFRYGKDEPLIATVEFAPPQGLDSAAMGYIIDGQVNDRDIVSLLLEWGKKGYLKIEDQEEHLLLVWQKDIDADVPAYEKDLFAQLFANGRTEVSTDDLQESFYTSINKCRDSIMKYFSHDKALYTGVSRGLQVLACLCCGIPLGLILGLTNYAGSYRVSAIWLNLGIAVVLFALISFCLSVVRANWYTLSKAMRFVWGLSSAVLLSLVLFLYAIANARYVSWQYLLIAMVLTLLMLYFAIPMSKRTAYGDKLLGHAVGLREFIRITEEDRLKLMVEENPFIFYDVLPYAYAFGLTDVWQKHFANIGIPPVDFYQSNAGVSNYMMIRHLERSLTSVQSSMVSVPPSSSSGGGSFGGGGGGFSGGGFGGGGGGSW